MIVFFLQLNQEFAGLGGNVGFFKNELELQVPWKFDITTDIVQTSVGHFNFEFNRQTSQ